MPYVDVAGLTTWHEVTGSGDPVVLLHGAFAGADSWFAQVHALVAVGYAVHAPERRGSRSTSRPCTPSSRAPWCFRATATR